MKNSAKSFSLSACAMAVTLLVSACGGGAGTDTVVPTLAITDDVSAATATGVVNFTFTFSEDVGSSFVVEDVVVTGGTVGTLTKVNATSYTLAVTPTANATGTIGVNVASSKYTDLAFNANTAASTASQDFNTVSTATGTVLASFDEPTPLVFVGFDGGEGSAIAAGPAGGSGNALKILRSGGQVWAGAKVGVGSINLTADNRTISARVYSPTAGTRMVLKLEGTGVASAEVDATETVSIGWQTLTWVMPSAEVGKAFVDVVMLPNLGTLGAGEAYYFDDITLDAPPPTVTPVDTVLATFDEATPLVFVGFDGGEGSAIAAGPAGGSGNALKILRSGGQVWAGAKVGVGSINLTADNRTISARVYSPTAGTRMVLKLEGTGVASAEVDATETVSIGWQTLTWVMPSAEVGKAFVDVVMLPNLGTLGAGESYYFDEIKLVGGGAATGGGGGTGGGVTPNPTAAPGSAGPVAIPLLTATYLGDFGAVGNAVFAGDYIGSLDSNGNRAGWASATTNGLASNGNIGYFQDAVLEQSSQKLEENGWVAGLTDNAGGVPSFFRYFILKGPSATFANSYMGLYANAPNNGTVDVSSYGSIKFRLWGPAEMYQQGNFNPSLEMKLTGPKVDGCTATGSGATEIKKTFVANQKIGAASTYTLSLAGWTVVGSCGTDTAGTAVASVLSKLAQVVVVVPGTSFNFTNINSDNISYTTGVNLGPIIFTAN